MSFHSFVQQIQETTEILHWHSASFLPSHRRIHFASVWCIDRLLLFPDSNWRIQAARWSNWSEISVRTESELFDYRSTTRWSHLRHLHCFVADVHQHLSLRLFHHGFISHDFVLLCLDLLGIGEVAVATFVWRRRRFERSWSDAKIEGRDRRSCHCY